MGLHGGVAGEQLIATIAAQRDFHVLAREHREQIRGDERRVSKRFVEQVGEARDQIQEHLRLERQLAMLGA